MAETLLLAAPEQHEQTQMPAPEDHTELPTPVEASVPETTDFDHMQTVMEANKLETDAIRQDRIRIAFEDQSQPSTKIEVHQN